MSRNAFGGSASAGQLVGTIFDNSPSPSPIDLAASSSAPIGPMTVAQALATYNANPQTPPIAVDDTAANVSFNLDAMLPITATDQVYLYGVQPSQLTADDFLFT